MAIFGAEVLDYLDGNPATTADIAAATQSEQWLVPERMKKYIESGRLKTISQSYACGKLQTVYFRPGDEDAAWILYGKLHRKNVEDEEERELRPLQILGSERFVGARRFRSLSGEVAHEVLTDLCEEGLVERLIIGNRKPRILRGLGSETIFYYLSGWENLAAKEFVRHLMPLSEMTRGDRLSLGNTLKAMPEKLEDAIRNELGVEKKKREPVKTDHSMKIGALPSFVHKREAAHTELQPKAEPEASQISVEAVAQASYTLEQRNGASK